MKNASKVLLALGCGAAIGGILGVLFAPGKGSETRKKITDTADGFTKKVKDLKDSIVHKKNKEHHNGRTGIENEVNEYVS